MSLNEGDSEPTIEDLENGAKGTVEEIEIKVMYNKQPLDVIIASDKSVHELKEIIALSTGISADKQKLMWSKGACPDHKTLKEIGARTGAKFMMIGTSDQEVSKVQSKPDLATLKELQETNTTQKKLCEIDSHRKVIDKGMPSDIMPGILGEREPLPPHPITGMLDKRGMPIRLSFKLDLGQVWINTNEKTKKLPLAAIRNVVSEPVVGHEEYSIVGLQEGTTEASRIWLYWVPSQYVEAIKEIFGQFDLASR